ncbi:MAG TPA: MFS transporter, partial [Usitatibacter sp.]|nr:MFS transporter [Usitatibacter sp.]
MSAHSHHLPDSRYAWTRLAITMVLISLGSSTMYVVPVVFPAVQADFGVDRAAVSASYAMLMVGMGVGGIFMGRLADRHGMLPPLVIGGLGIALGFAIAGSASSLATFNVAHGLLVGLLGSSAMFSPLLADTSLWFVRRRGIAVAICASGNFLGGAIWPPVVQHFVASAGWRHTYLGMGVVAGALIVALAFAMRPRPPLTQPAAAASRVTPDGDRPFGLSPTPAQVLLCIAGLACCVAMSMPQVHIVAYCADLGYGPARGAQMLSLMFACGIVSRLASGWICDHIGGLRTLLLGSTLQAVALMLFLPFNGLVSLYVLSALFGLFQGGIVPSYAIIVREHFAAKETGARVGAVIMCTMVGMALGGWMSGKVYDLTGSYQAAFLNGIAWNVLNLSIAGFLLLRTSRAARLVPRAS